MSGRVAKRSRRVAEAEAALTTHRLLLREEIRELAADARAAATPGRIVVGGLALGALAGLVSGRRSKASAGTPAKPGLMQSLTGVVRLVSMVMPMLAPLIGMVQGAASAQAGPAAPAAGGGGAGVGPADPLP